MKKYIVAMLSLCFSILYAGEADPQFFVFTIARNVRLNPKRSITLMEISVDQNKALLKQLVIWRLSDWSKSAATKTSPVAVLTIEILSVSWIRMVLKSALVSI